MGSIGQPSKRGKPYQLCCGEKVREHNIHELEEKREVSPKEDTRACIASINLKLLIRKKSRQKTKKGALPNGGPGRRKEGEKQEKEREFKRLSSKTIQGAREGGKNFKAAKATGLVSWGRGKVCDGRAARRKRQRLNSPAREGVCQCRGEGRATTKSPPRF